MREFKKGMIVRYFKKDLLEKHPRNNGKYLYQIIALAKREENQEILVVYQELYGSFPIYAKELHAFGQKVDKTKYPTVKQVYCFEEYKSMECS